MRWVRDHAKVTRCFVQPSENCDVVITKASARHGHVCRVIAAELDHARNLPEFVANDNSAAGGSSHNDGDGVNLSDADT